MLEAGKTMTDVFEVIKITLDKCNNGVTMIQPCNLEQMAIGTRDGFDYAQFLETDCTALAFFLHDTFNLKIGAIRAIDQDNDGDIDYSTVVHQFVYITDDLILDARGIDTKEAMLRYFEDLSIHDDENWHFIIDSDYQHSPSGRSHQSNSKDIQSYKYFLALLMSEFKEIVLKNCACCGAKKDVSKMLVCMHAQMHRYVCDMTCMNMFYEKK